MYDITFPEIVQIPTQYIGNFLLIYYFLQYLFTSYSKIHLKCIVNSNLKIKIWVAKKKKFL